MKIFDYKFNKLNQQNGATTVGPQTRKPHRGTTDAVMPSAKRRTVS